nr:MAG TPA: Ig-like domain protein [Caudoviricetes sp.]
MSLSTVKATINGQTYNLTLNSSTGKYEAVITAPASSSYNQSGHYYPVSVTATDTAGNSTTIDNTDATLGSKLQLVVKEKTPPVITITAPTASALIVNNKPVITWTVTDDDSGVNANSIGITIDSGSKVTSGITKTAISNGYKCTYTPTAALADGSHTIKVDASDNDGNAATQKSVTFKVDTVPPTLSITSPANGLVTKSSSVTVIGKTNDVTSSPVTVTVNGAKVTVAEDGSFTSIVSLKEGSNTITVIATDSSGQKTTVTRTVTMDTTVPVFKSVTVTPNPVDAGKTYTITVEVTD